MTEVTANLTVQVQDPDADVPFELKVDDGEFGGNVPVQLKTDNYRIRISNWGFVQHPQDRSEIMQVGELGVCFVRLYTSEAVAAQTRVSVDSASDQMDANTFLWSSPSVADSSVQVVKQGRMESTIIEKLELVDDREVRLAYWYDSPDVEVLAASEFYDSSLETGHRPVYVPSDGAFLFDRPVTGQMVVRYAPSFTLYRFEYDAGQSVSSVSHWKAIQDAWMADGLDKAEMPPVTVVAMSTSKVDLLSVERKVWPNKPPGLVTYANYSFTTEKTAPWPDPLPPGLPPVPLRGGPPPPVTPIPEDSPTNTMNENADGTFTDPETGETWVMNTAGGDGPYLQGSGQFEVLWTKEEVMGDSLCSFSATINFLGAISTPASGYGLDDALGRLVRFVGINTDTTREETVSSAETSRIQLGRVAWYGVDGCTDPNSSGGGSGGDLANDGIAFEAFDRFKDQYGEAWFIYETITIDTLPIPE